MALIPVRPKDAPDGAPIVHVDEAWLKRWPDDYEPVTDEQLAAFQATATEQTPVATGQTPADGGELAPGTDGATEQAARGRF